MWSVVLFIVALSVIGITHWLHRWRNPRCNGILPPGSMGLPIIRETLKFFAPYSLSGISPFLAEKMNRYGSLFRTSLVGYPVVVSTDAEINHFIFQQEGRLFQSWYMDSFTELFGGRNVQDVDTFVHKYLRNIISSLFGPENLKLKLLPEIEQNARIYLQLWSTQQSVELKDGISDMIFYLTAKKMISYDEAKSSCKLRENFAEFIKGLISFPVNIPGTTYYKCLQGRKKAMKFLKHTLDERRRASPEMHHGDFLDLIIDELKKEDAILTEGFALDLIFVLLFASYETTSSALTLGMKFLVEHPVVLEELKKEHESIIRKRKSLDTGLTWLEYKSMTFTFMVINEILRLANVAPGFFRKTLKEVKLKGYTIPQGWAVMISPPTIHLNPLNYEDPLIFNPWQWKDVEVIGGSKNFIPFGGGSRYCVGADMAKVQMAVFLHCLVTEYRWTIIKGGEISRAPGLMFPNGVHVQLTKNKINQAGD